MGLLFGSLALQYVHWVTQALDTRDPWQHRHPPRYVRNYVYCNVGRNLIMCFQSYQGASPIEIEVHLQCSADVSIP